MQKSPAIKQSKEVTQARHATKAFGETSETVAASPSNTTVAQQDGVVNSSSTGYCNMYFAGNVPVLQSNTQRIVREKTTDVLRIGWDTATSSGRIRFEKGSLLLYELAAALVPRRNPFTKK